MTDKDLGKRLRRRREIRRKVLVEDGKTVTFQLESGNLQVIHLGDRVKLRWEGDALHDVLAVVGVAANAIEVQPWTRDL